MFCPPTLTKIPSGQPGSPGLNGEFLDSLEFLAPFSRDPLHIHMEPSAHTSKSFPAPQHLLLVGLLSLGCNIPTPESPLEGMAWTRPALGRGASVGMSGQRILGPMHCSKKRGASLFASNS